MDGFERALDAGDRESFAYARDALLMQLSQLDFPFEYREERSDG